MGQHAIFLATFLVKDHFGEIVSKVCECLLRKGALQLRDVVRYTALNQSQVKNCLLVLIQHNCVQAFSLPIKSQREESEVVGTFYMAILDNIIHRMRFTKFLDVVNAEFADELIVTPGPKPAKICPALLILESLLQHGRLTFEQLVEHAISKSRNIVTRDIIFVNFNKLVQARYVERCPKSEPFLLPETEEDARPKRRGAKFTLDTMTLEKQALEAATLSNAERFMGIVDSARNAMDPKDSEEFPRVGEKRKHGDSLQDDEVLTLNSEKDYLWRANFDKFTCYLKRKLCVANKRARLGLDAAVVLEAMMEASNCPQDNVRSSLDEIFKRVQGKSQGRIMNIQHTRTILEELGCHSSVEEAITFYTVDLKETIKDCQLDEVESLILARYGQDACRIFRLLSKNNKPFETDKISDLTFVDKKISLGLLLSLWKNNFLNMEKMDSGATTKSYFLWKVNRNAVWEHILEDMYHAAANLNQRITLNYEKDKEIADCRSINPLQKPLQACYYNKKWTLESALLKLDDSILLFHDFTL